MGVSLEPPRSARAAHLEVLGLGEGVPQPRPAAQQPDAHVLGVHVQVPPQQHHVGRLRRVPAGMAPAQPPPPHPGEGGGETGTPLPGTPPATVRGRSPDELQQLPGLHHAVRQVGILLPAVLGVQLPKMGGQRGRDLPLQLQGALQPTRPLWGSLKSRGCWLSPPTGPPPHCTARLLGRSPPTLGNISLNCCREGTAKATWPLVSPTPRCSRG